MGLETSKNAPGCVPPLSGFRSFQKPKPWSQVVSIPINKWKPELAEFWGFDHMEEWWSSKYFKVSKRPWSSFSVSYRCGTGRDRKLCSFTCEVVETGREEKLSGFVKDLSIIAFHQRIIVVQVILSRSVKLLVVNWKNGSLLGTYSFFYNREPCFQECMLSPDGSYLLCRQNFLLRRKCHHVTSFDSNIRVLQVKDGLCRRLFIIEDSLVLNCLGSGISFDPRYPSRVIIMASNQQEVSRGQISDEADVSGNIQMYDIHDRRLLKSTESHTNTMIHHMRHTPDGSFFVAVCVNLSIFINCNVSIHSILFYNSDTLYPIHRIPLQGGISKFSHIPLFPMFSRNTDLVAISTGEQNSNVQLIQLPSHYHNSLQEICRHCIVGLTPKRYIDKLPLPPKLISFLKYEIKQ